MAQIEEEPGEAPPVARHVLAITGLTAVVLIAIVALVVLFCCLPALWYRSLSPDLPFN